LSSPRRRSLPRTAQEFVTAIFLESLRRLSIDNRTAQKSVAANSLDSLRRLSIDNTFRIQESITVTPA